jgi:hypothetical protein
LEKLDDADLILLLISPDFVESEVGWREERLRAMKRYYRDGTKVIPILLKVVDSYTALLYDLLELQALPAGGKPTADWLDSNEAYDSIVKGIRDAIEELRARGG